MNLKYKDNHTINISDYKYYSESIDLMQKKLEDILKEDDLSNFVIEIININEQINNIENFFYIFAENSCSNNNIIIYNQIKRKLINLKIILKNDNFIKKIKSVKNISKKIKFLIDEIIYGNNFELSKKAKIKYEENLLKQYKDINKYHEKINIEYVHSEEERKLIKIKKDKIDNYDNLLNIIQYRNYESKEKGYKNFNDYLKKSIVFSSKLDKKLILESMIDFYYNESIKLYPNLLNEEEHDILYNMVNKNYKKQNNIYFDSTIFINEFIKLVENFYDIKIIFGKKLHLKNINLFYIEKNNKIIGQIKMFLSNKNNQINAYSMTLDKNHKIYKKINYIYIDGIQNKDSFCIDEMNTIVHEFGHAMHDIMSDEVCFALNGLNIEDDIVEVPSQLFEHMIMEKDFLKRIYRRSINNKNFTENLYRDIKMDGKNPFFDLILTGKALMDFELFSNNVSNKNDIKNIENKINKKVFKNINYKLNISDNLFVYGKDFDLDGRYSAYLISELYACFFAKNINKKGIFIEKFIKIKREESMMDNLNSIISIKDIIEFYKNINKS